jgi:CBS domain containing-hemolysin-like protein
VAESQKEGMLTDQSGALTAAFEFTTKIVADIRIPLDALVTVPEDATPTDVQQAVSQHGFSRYVLRDESDRPTGYVHIKDVLDVPDDQCDYPVSPKKIRPMISLPDSADLEDALAMMRRTGSHLARVHGPDGTPVGVLFLEDVIEELVGEVRDATRRGHRPTR